MDELIADYRLDEAESVCEAMSALDNSCRVPFYHGKIAWVRGEHQKAKSIWEEMLSDHNDDWLSYANMADAMAYACRYDEAITSCYEQLDVLKAEWNITEGREVERIHDEINRLRNLSIT